MEPCPGVAVAFAATAALAVTVVGSLGGPISAFGARTRGRRGRGGGGGGGECSSWSFLAVLHGEFLEDEILTRLQEGRERFGPAKERADVAEALVKAADDVEDEGAVRDDLADGREIIGHLLQLAAVLGDGEVALDEVAKPRLQLNGAGLPIAEELRLDGEPGVSGSGAPCGDDLA